MNLYKSLIADFFNTISYILYNMSKTYYSGPSNKLHFHLVLQASLHLLLL